MNNGPMTIHVCRYVTAGHIVERKVTDNLSDAAEIVNMFLDNGYTHSEIRVFGTDKGTEEYMPGVQDSAGHDFRMVWELTDTLMAIRAPFYHITPSNVPTIEDI